MADYYSVDALLPDFIYGQILHVDGRAGDDKAL